ncbi:MAG: zinc-ribbon domain containing protein [Rhizobiaceae bacterium]
MQKNNNKYADYVEHPVYGREPIYSGIEPKLGPKDAFVLMNRCWMRGQIKGTAVEADYSKQGKGASYLIKYYFDEEKVCCDCNRPFILFAKEQKRWIEELGININVSGDRCQPCRKQHRQGRVNNLRYAELKAIDDPTTNELLDMADICLQEVEAGRFNRRQLQTAQALLRKASNEPGGSDGDGESLQTRLNQKLKLLLEQL